MTHLYWISRLFRKSRGLIAQKKKIKRGWRSGVHHAFIYRRRPKTPDNQAHERIIIIIMTALKARERSDFQDAD